MADISATSPPGAPSHARPVRRWQELAIEWLPTRLGRFLDYGCGPCGLLERLHDRCEECHGVDVDADKIRAAQALFPQFSLAVIGFDGRAPYPSGFFDTVAAIEVIEHVPDERSMMAELARLTRPGGRVLITTPHRGWLTFLDPGNFKFVLPRLHRFVHLYAKRNREYYENRFVRGEQKGLAGDISMAQNRRAWHRHYTPEQILAFCPDSLQVERVGIYFPAMRAILALRLAMNVCTGGLVKRFFWPISAIERRLSCIESRGGDQLVMMFRKLDGPNQAGSVTNCVSHRL